MLNIKRIRIELYKKDRMFLDIIPVLVLMSISSADVLPTSIVLNDGNRMPAVSFGTWGRVSYVDKLIKPAVIQAIESGFRQIDTASLYENEEQVGEAIADVIRRGIVTRKDLFITTKLDFLNGTRENVVPALQASLKRLQLDYVDMYLIHTPYNFVSRTYFDYLSTWKGMEEIKKSNLARSIGVSNFNIHEIKNILANSNTTPAVNEIEVNPSFTNMDLVTYCQSKNITVLSYAPFGFLVPRPFTVNPTTITFKEPILMEIAQKYGKLTSQVVLRYLIDLGTIPIPGSTNTKHIKTNIDVLDFFLTSEEIELIKKLNTNSKVYNSDVESINNIMEYFLL